MNRSLTLLFCTFLSLAGAAAHAQDIPAAFRGQWVTNWEGKPTAKKAREYCKMPDIDTAVTLTVRKNTMTYGYWEAGEEVDRLSYTRRTPTLIKGTARYTQSGFDTDENGDLLDTERVFRRNISLELKNGKLVELFLDHTPKPTWRKRIWYRCK